MSIIKHIKKFIKVLSFLVIVVCVCVFAFLLLYLGRQTFLAHSFRGRFHGKIVYSTSYHLNVLDLYTMKKSTLYSVRGNENGMMDVSILRPRWLKNEKKSKEIFFEVQKYSGPGDDYPYTPTFKISLGKGNKKIVSPFDNRYEQQKFLFYHGEGVLPVHKHFVSDKEGTLSPNLKYVIFLFNEELGRYSYLLHIRLVNLSTKRTKRYTVEMNNMVGYPAPIWSPNSSKIAFLDGCNSYDYSPSIVIFDLKHETWVRVPVGHTPPRGLL